MLTGLKRVAEPGPAFSDEALLTLCAAHEEQLAEAKLALGGAVRWSEEWTARSVMRQTWAVTYSEFPARGLELPRGPVAAVTSVTVRRNGAEEVLEEGVDFRVALHLDPARVVPVGTVAVDTVDDAVTIVYETGSEDFEEVDPTLALAVSLATQQWFEHPEDQEGSFFRSLKSHLRPVRVANINGVR